MLATSECPSKREGMLMYRYISICIYVNNILLLIIALFVYPAYVDICINVNLRNVN